VLNILGMLKPLIPSTAALLNYERLYTHAIPHLCLRLLSYSRFFTNLT